VYATDMLAMIAIFSTLTMVMIMTVGATAIVLNNALKRYFELRELELELRRWEGERRVEQVRMSASIPAWVNHDDPLEVSAWNRAVAETWRTSARSSLPMSARRSTEA
jgi:hypothetical protein